MRLSLLNIKQFLRSNGLIRGLVAGLILSQIFWPISVEAQTISAHMPRPGAMVGFTSHHTPVLIRGVIVDPLEPFRFDFLLDTGNNISDQQVLQEESTRLIKYFLASLTVPEEDLWVNLSPYENERIIPEYFGVTEMGRDLLAQDYLLKQLTATVMYPEEELGQKFWDKVRTRALVEFGTMDVPVNSFNKVWIVPDKAVIYEQGTSAFIVEARLKVMLEKDYLAWDANGGTLDAESMKEAEEREGLDAVTRKIIREVVIPEIESEVNAGTNFAALRQIYHSLILASWYKQSIQESLINQLYSDQNKVAGVDVEDRSIKEKIYQQYIEAFKEGVYDYIKEEFDPVSQELIPRKYFSGGMKLGLQTSDILERTTRADRFQILGDPLLVQADFRSTEQSVELGTVDEAMMADDGDGPSRTNDFNRRDTGFQRIRQDVNQVERVELSPAQKAVALQRRQQEILRLREALAPYTQSVDTLYYPGIGTDIETALRISNARRIVGVDIDPFIGDAPDITSAFRSAIEDMGGRIILAEATGELNQGGRLNIEFEYDGVRREFVFYQGDALSRTPSTLPETRDGYDMFFEQAPSFDPTPQYTADIITTLNPNGIFFGRDTFVDTQSSLQPKIRVATPALGNVWVKTAESTAPASPTVWESFVPQGIKSDPAWRRDGTYVDFENPWMGTNVSAEVRIYLFKRALEAISIELPEIQDGLVMGFGETSKELEEIKDAFDIKSVRGAEWVADRVRGAARGLQENNRRPEEFTLYHEDIRDLNGVFADRSFDFIYAGAISDDLRNASPRIAREIVRLLRLGGIALFDESNPEFLQVLSNSSGTLHRLSGAGHHIYIGSDQAMLVNAVDTAEDAFRLLQNRDRQSADNFNMAFKTMADAREFVSKGGMLRFVGDIENPLAVLMAERRPNPESNFIYIADVITSLDGKNQGLGRGLMRDFVRKFGAENSIGTNLLYFRGDDQAVGGAQRAWEEFHQGLGFKILGRDDRYYFRTPGPFNQADSAMLALNDFSREFLRQVNDYQRLTEDHRDIWRGIVSRIQQGEEGQGFFKFGIIPNTQQLDFSTMDLSETVEGHVDLFGQVRNVTGRIVRGEFYIEKGNTFQIALKRPNNIIDPEKIADLYPGLTIPERGEALDEYLNDLYILAARMLTGYNPSTLDFDDNALVDPQTPGRLERNDAQFERMTSIGELAQQPLRIIRLENPDAVNYSASEWEQIEETLNVLVDAANRYTTVFTGDVFTEYFSQIKDWVDRSTRITPENIDELSGEAIALLSEVEAMSTEATRTVTDQVKRVRDQLADEYRNNQYTFFNPESLSLVDVKGSTVVHDFYNTFGNIFHIVFYLPLTVDPSSREDFFEAQNSLIDFVIRIERFLEFFDDIRDPLRVTSDSLLTSFSEAFPEQTYRDFLIPLANARRRQAREDRAMLATARTSIVQDPQEISEILDEWYAQNPQRTFERGKWDILLGIGNNLELMTVRNPDEKLMGIAAFRDTNIMVTFDEFTPGFSAELMEIDEGLRGQRLGRFVMSQLAQESLSRSDRTMPVVLHPLEDGGVTADSQPMRRYYEKMGFYYLPLPDEADLEPDEIRQKYRLQLSAELANRLQESIDELIQRGQATDSAMLGDVNWEINDILQDRETLDIYRIVGITGAKDARESRIVIEKIIGGRREAVLVSEAERRFRSDKNYNESDFYQIPEADRQELARRGFEDIEVISGGVQFQFADRQVDNKTVFAARDSNNERDVVVIVHKDSLEVAEFYEEWNQPGSGIMAIYESGTFTDGSNYMIAERFEGTTIEDLSWGQDEGFPVSQMVRSILEFVGNLSEFHERNFFHGDLSPGNFIVSDEGRVTAIDLSKAYQNMYYDLEDVDLADIPDEWIQRQQADDIASTGQALLNLVTGNNEGFDYVYGSQQDLSALLRSMTDKKVDLNAIELNILSTIIYKMLNAGIVALNSDSDAIQRIGDDYYRTMGEAREDLLNLQAILDAAMLADGEDAETGGIDLTPDKLNLEIQRDDASGVPAGVIPLPSSDVQIEGLYPVIINILPVSNLPVLLGTAEQDDPTEVGWLEFDVFDQSLDLVRKPE